MYDREMLADLADAIEGLDIPVDETVLRKRSPYGTGSTQRSP